MGEGSAIIEPSQGRPVIVAPGDDLYFLMQLPRSFHGKIYVALVHHRIPDVRRELAHRTPPKIIGSVLTLILQVPEKIPAGLYDLEVGEESAERSKVRQFSCVRVVERFKSQFRIVHLSDMDIGELTAPDFDRQLIEEINLLAPEFILATGNYSHWARVNDQPETWQAVKKFFGQFEAPVFMLCGDRDHEDSFNRHIATSKVGTMDYGNYHGLLLLDHGVHPVEQDGDQLQWIINALTERADAKMNFIVCNSPTLGLIEHWRRQGDLDGFVRRHRLRMVVTGGHQDPLGKALERIVGQSGLEIIQTHESSTARIGGASGTTHYRVIEIDGDRISYTYPSEADDGRVHSIPAGNIRVRYEGPNDGTTNSVTAVVFNGLNQKFQNCRLSFCLTRPTSGPNAERLDPGVQVVGGRLGNTIMTAKRLYVEVEVDLPDKSTRKVLVTTEGWIPPLPAITIGYEGPKQLVFAHKGTEPQPQPGPAYVSDQNVALTLRNTGQSALSAWPVVRLNGEQIEPKLPPGRPWPITVPPGRVVKVPLRLELYRVSRGPHQLQVYLLRDALVRLSTFDVTLSQGP